MNPVRWLVEPLFPRDQPGISIQRNASHANPFLYQIVHGAHLHAHSPPSCKLGERERERMKERKGKEGKRPLFRRRRHALEPIFSLYACMQMWLRRRRSSLAVGGRERKGKCASFAYVCTLCTGPACNVFLSWIMLWSVGNIDLRKRRYVAQTTNGKKCWTVTSF